MCIRNQFGQVFGLYGDTEGIEVNPILLRVIMKSHTPTSRKGVQQLTGRLADLGRFISRFIDRLKPFLTTLKGAKLTSWNRGHDWAFTTIKQYLTEPSVLASPKVGDTDKPLSY